MLLNHIPITSLVYESPGYGKSLCLLGMSQMHSRNMFATFPLQICRMPLYCLLDTFIMLTPLGVRYWVPTVNVLAYCAVDTICAGGMFPFFHDFISFGCFLKLHLSKPCFSALTLSDISTVFGDLPPITPPINIANS